VSDIALRLASIPQIGADLLRRVEIYANLAEDAAERARASTDLLVVGDAADASHAASQRAGDLALAVLGCLGPGDDERRAYERASMARQWAERAARRWQLMARLAGKGAHV
jgi:hypothetical protein